MSVGHLYTRAYSTSIGGGSVVSVKIVQERQSGQPRDTAFVEMPMPWKASCLHALPAGLHGENPDGKKATVVSRKDRDRDSKELKTQQYGK